MTTNGVSSCYKVFFDELTTNHAAAVATCTSVGAVLAKSELHDPTNVNGEFGFRVDALCPRTHNGQTK